MAVHVYDVLGRRLYCRATLDEVKADLLTRTGRPRRRYRTTWDDRTGERHEYRDRQWRQTQAPDVDVETGSFDPKMAAAGEYLP